MRVPSYRLHRASGQAVVTILGKDIYLGPHDSPESHQKYRQVIATFIGTGGPPIEEGVRLTVREAAHRWQIDRRARLSPKDRHHFDTVLGIAVDLFGNTPLRDFGPVRFQAVRA